MAQQDTVSHCRNCGAKLAYNPSDFCRPCQRKEDDAVRVPQGHGHGQERGAGLKVAIRPEDIVDAAACEWQVETGELFSDGRRAPAVAVEARSAVMFLLTVELGWTVHRTAEFMKMVNPYAVKEYCERVRGRLGWDGRLEKLVSRTREKAGRLAAERARRGSASAEVTR